MYEKLFQVLEARGISRYELSKMANIHATDIYCTLSGKRPMYPGWKKRIADALELPEEDLFN